MAFANCHGGSVLLDQINCLRNKLERQLNKSKQPTKEEIVKISQELDKLIVTYYRIKNNKGEL